MRAHAVDAFCIHSTRRELESIQPKAGPRLDDLRPDRLRRYRLRRYRLGERERAKWLCVDCDHVWARCVGDSSCSISWGVTFAIVLGNDLDTGKTRLPKWLPG